MRQTAQQDPVQSPTHTLQEGEMIVHPVKSAHVVTQQERVETTPFCCHSENIIDMNIFQHILIYISISPLNQGSSRSLLPEEGLFSYSYTHVLLPSILAPKPTPFHKKE